MAHKATILAVDDDALIRGLLEELLTAEGYKVKTVANAFQARGALVKVLPDLLILDRGLPDVEGVEFIREVRGLDGFGQLPVLFLTARGTPAEKTEGLLSGADDYLAKPFDAGELLARVGALLRRTLPEPEPKPFLKARGILVDLASHAVTASGKKVHLPPKEYELLVALLEKRGRVLSRHFLLERVWGEGAELNMNTKTVDVAVGRLRAALGPFGDHIVAVQSYGYKIDVPDA